MNKLWVSVLAFTTAVGLVSVSTSLAEQTESSANTAPPRLKLTSADDVARCIDESGQADAFVETRYVDDSPMPVIQAPEQRRGYLVFERPWMDLVFPNSIPKRTEITNQLETFAAPGEYEPVTFCVRTLKSITGLKVVAGDLASQNGGRIAAPQVQIVRCVPRLLRGEEPLYEGGPVGVMNMPTYLENSRLLDVVADRTVQVWLTIKVDQDREPGSYDGEVQISHDQSRPYRMKIKLEILPVALIEPALRLGFWDFQRPYHGEIGDLDQVYQVMRRHGINAVFTHAGIFDYDKKTDTYDFSKYMSVDNNGRAVVSLDGSLLEERAEAARRAGLDCMIYNPHLPIFVSGEVQKRYDREVLEKESQIEVARVLKRYEKSKHYEMIKKEITNTSEKLFPMYSEAYAALYVQILRAILNQAERRDWPTLLVDPGDETFSAHVHDRIAFPRAVRYLELMKRAGATTIMNHLSPTMGGEYGEYGGQALRYLDIGMPGLRVSATSPYGGTIEKTAQDFTDLGITTYTYSNSGQAGVTPDLSVARFNAGFFFATLGRQVRGEFDYIFYRPEGDPYNPVDIRRLWSHERMWFFPPQEKAGRLGGPALVLAAKRQGLDDLRYLRTLEGLIKQAEFAPNSPDLQQVARAANATRTRILESFTFTDQGLDTNRRALISRWDAIDASSEISPVVKGGFRLHNGWNFEDYDRNRRDLAEAAIQLQQALTQRK